MAQHHHLLLCRMQVYINGQFVGGCDDLEAAINSATIQQLLSGALGERELPAALAAAVAQAQQVSVLAGMLQCGRL
jgi:hypothetical protein